MFKLTVCVTPKCGSKKAGTPSLFDKCPRRISTGIRFGNRAIPDIRGSASLDSEWLDNQKRTQSGAWSPSAPIAPVLYAEDSEDDVFFMQHAFAKAGIPNPLRILSDGQDAIDYLGGNGAFANREEYPLPCLLLLDLNLPGKSGFEVLRWIREHPALRNLKVVIVSASGQTVDTQTAQKLGVTDYVVKPNGPSKLLSVINDRKTRCL